jgi:hypothetical protein
MAGINKTIFCYTDTKNVCLRKRAVPEVINPFFTETSPKRSFSMTENARFGLVFAKTGSVTSGTGCNIAFGNTAGNKKDEFKKGGGV